jgi:hypothetical protein
MLRALNENWPETKVSERLSYPVRRYFLRIRFSISVPRFIFREKDCFKAEL